VQEQEDLLEFLRIPRTRREITKFLGLKSQAYAMRRYVTPLIQEGVVVITDSETPKARGQQYYVK
jgi:ATP-dependent DNA helicase RecG